MRARTNAQSCNYDAQIPILGYKNKYNWYFTYKLAKNEGQPFNSYSDDLYGLPVQNF